MREKHLVLNLTLHKQDNTCENVTVELSKDELDEFIDKLERAKKVCNTIFLFFLFSFNNVISSKDC